MFRGISGAAQQTSQSDVSTTAPVLKGGEQRSWAIVEDAMRAAVEQRKQGPFFEEVYRRVYIFVLQRKGDVVYQ
ncbi:MAG: hypothetical protein EZS28_002222 [Streblomastix strix]|uniref:Uncharacterized protein n=1 Tax=Streblomastix strix TaxID=222440 RepID=A0A5J4X4Z7_9EUKA|nr:MAG: hypothetical protein EZS28_002222 [Streblomastix strix]